MQFIWLIIAILVVAGAIMSIALIIDVGLFMFKYKDGKGYPRYVDYPFGSLVYWFTERK